MPRRYDPGRRERIVDAAVRVVAEKGLAGLSHRTVAAAADVPLGSTTYHFETLDDLLVAAFRRAGENYLDVIAAGDSLTSGTTGLAADLARLTGEWLAGGRTGLEMEYELYLAALRRPALRPVAAEWTARFTALLTRRTDPVTARAVAALIDGVCLQVLLTDAAYDEECTREMLARLLP
ncbi:TetR/AcrR family transcriptional regulator [Streptomyces sp. CRN 30]|uniref:TetR/AcrR family transcriptional regulator n=1 Tax=Streptomyces sp. CRN 30 TaxID=3075613 RepID=UPI002A813AED|nr:TetR family transcriptional regulator [Streptomyces sp. CRN 30]